jgi:hypothetical protein
MADISSGTPEAVAFELLEKIRVCEGKMIGLPAAPTTQVTVQPTANGSSMLMPIACM